MRIICPTCSSHYEVDSNKIEPNGQLVRCAQCREVWLVHAPPRAVAPARAPAAKGGPALDGASRTLRTELVGAGAVAPIDFHAAKIRLRPRKDAIEEERARGGALGAITVGAVVLASFMSLYGFRAAITRHVPEARAAYAAVGLPVDDYGLALRDVHSALVAEANGTVLTLEGKIANLRDRSTAVPPLTLVVQGEANVPLYTWTTAAPKSMLQRGETIAFRSRLAEPPAAGRNIQVSFASKSDGVEVLSP